MSDQLHVAIDRPFQERFMFNWLRQRRNARAGPERWPSPLTDHLMNDIGLPPVANGLGAKRFHIGMPPVSDPRWRQQDNSDRRRPHRLNP